MLKRKLIFLRSLLLAVFISLFFNVFLASVQAEECTDYQCSAIENDDERAVCVDKKIACYQQKIDESKNQQDTLSNAIGGINNRIALTEQQIEKLRLEIIRAKKEVEILSSRIDNLVISEKKLSLLTTQLIVNAYKAGHLSDLEMYLSSLNFTTALQKKSQDETVGLQSRKLLFEASQRKNELLEKKAEREKKQVDLEEKTKQLKTQQEKLNAQKLEKTLLLSQTKNDEKKYQQLQADARKEADAFRRFAASAGGGSCLGSGPGSGSNGYFFSQRDPSWCKQYVGGSSLTVGEVGCYLTSVAMIHKKTGVSTSPSILAANRNYFFSNTALMLTPPAPAGYTYRRYDYFKASLIDDEIKAERPVIVHVRTNNGYGGHFIVLFQGEDGNYTMHDPWHGPDLKFSRYYSTSQIDSIRTFSK